MRPFDEIETRIKALVGAGGAGVESEAAATELLILGEEVLEHWIMAQGNTPTNATHEGFRLLALHRQGTKGVPSFNACRETCRELVYHHNLIVAEPTHPAVDQRVKMAGMVAHHLYLFVRGKLEESKLGEFCCSSRQLRA